MIRLIFIITIFLSVAHVNATTIQDTVKSCKDCHTTLISKKVLHAPADESCENCHMPNDNQHPQEGLKGFQLADEPATLCFYCHEEYTKTNKHAPAESGECLMCHDPHSSNSAALLKEANSKALCMQCHDFEIPKTDIVHAPVKNGACHECHDPHQSDQSAFLKSAKPDLCFSCHKNIAELATASVKHAVFEDDCFNCHQPHSAPAKGLLMEATPTLCFNCHSDVQEQVDTAKVVHKVMNDKKACVKCHSPHASNNTAMLTKSGNDLCLSCHKRTYTTDAGKTENIANKLKEGNTIHAPVEDACANCHQPHVSEYTSLLTNSFPKGTYAKASIENYALCFDCHDSELLTAETSTATNFRHGDNNMHFLHLKGDKGKNCTMCHDVHGAKNEHLISEKVPFGNWQMDMNYKVTDVGGSCATGCHAEKAYDKTFAISEEELTKLEEKKTTTSRYQSYEIEYHEVDSSVILANLELEQQRRIQDSINQVLIAQRIQDSIANSQRDSSLLLADVDSLIEEEEPVLAMEEPVVEYETAEETEPESEPEQEEQIAVSEVSKDSVQEETLAELPADSMEDSVTIEQEVTDEDIVLAENKAETDSLIESETVVEPDQEDEQLALSEDKEQEQEIVEKTEEEIMVEPLAIETTPEEVVEPVVSENAEDKQETKSQDPEIETPVVAVIEPKEVKEDISDDNIDKEVKVERKEPETKELTIEPEKEVAVISPDKHEREIITETYEFPTVSFGFSANEIGEERYKIIEVSKWLKNNPGEKIKILGYTDSIGTEEYNYYLSLQRAENVRNAIVEEGINRKRLTLNGMGEKNPIAPNNTPDGRTQNRRVEFILLREE